MDICVACPAGFATGGVELLHQLTAELDWWCGDAKIWYMFGRIENPTPERYLQYGNKITYKPTKDSILIFPEIWADYVNEYSDHICIIYWESVDNYFLHTKNNELIFPKTVYHLAQSKYAMRFLLDTVGVPKSHILFLTDCINETYFKQSEMNREQIVLYNPLKGKAFTEKLIEKASEILFIPIARLEQDSAKKLMQRSMVYIDFGDHPGKDRLPRETAMCGCCVITGLNGSALYDINIPRQYKFARQENNIPYIIKKIKDVFENYNICQQDFDEYRNTIKEEKLEFKYGVRQLVNRLAEGGTWRIM